MTQMQLDEALPGVAEGQDFQESPRRIPYLVRHRLRREVAPDAAAPPQCYRGRSQPGGRRMTVNLSELFESIVRNAPDAIVYADDAGVIRFWNSGAERIFGYAASEAVGQSLDIIIPERLRARHWEGFRRVMKTGQSRYGTGDLLAVPGQRKNGERVSLEFTIVPLREAGGRLLGMGAILRDVTPRFNEMKALRDQLAAKR
jgi:PAS domain S-box-containing protein